MVINRDNLQKNYKTFVGIDQTGAIAHAVAPHLGVERFQSMELDGLIDQLGGGFDGVVPRELRRDGIVAGLDAVTENVGVGFNASGFFAEQLAEIVMAHVDDFLRHLAKAEHHWAKELLEHACLEPDLEEWSVLAE